VARVYVHTCTRTALLTTLGAIWLTAAEAETIVKAVTIPGTNTTSAGTTAAKAEEAVAEDTDADEEVQVGDVDAVVTVTVTVAVVVTVTVTDQTDIDLLTGRAAVTQVIVKTDDNHVGL
jgi:hypothetical protein